MKHGLQNLKIALFALFALVFAILTIMQMIPRSTEGVYVHEKFSVSSSLINASGKEYSTQVSGALFNSTDTAMRITSVQVTVSDGDAEREIVLDGFLLPAHTAKSFLHTEDGAQAWKQVTGIRVNCEGEAIALSNTVGGSTLNGMTWILLAVTAIWTLLLVHACMVRYYMAQEDSMKSEE